ncbi:transmembrane channel-like protein 2-B [Nylanderia fulva]|uniref:transmembrane channel-like protein 2-B n=1 Tax=Nylanderia fulva TaxID=613905 RepID=UPI0010FB5EB6|nr:transmembrane channel-like protein 2-B [Nylanderia fulva]
MHTLNGITTIFIVTANGYSNLQYAGRSSRVSDRVNVESSISQLSASSMDQKPRSPGILRLEKMSRTSELGTTSSATMEVGPSFPSQSQSSASRQSVTFGTVECQGDENYAGDATSKTVADARSRDDMQHIVAAISTRANPAGETPQNPSTEKSTVNGEGNDSENDYSASVCAIMQRRNSIRRQSRRKRRPSSPFGVDVDNIVRRRSSAYTTSSGETVISMEEGGNQEQIFENLKLHKEVLSGVKQQPWPLRRKIKLVRQAKAYVRRHEGALQERLAQSRNTKDVIARVSLYVTKKWQHFRRELINLQTWFVPWELRIMEIESHFGSAVASYFTFLRWLFWINLVIAGTLTAFVAIPEVLTANATLAGERKIMLKEESVKSKHLLTLWEFEGVLKYSPFFYGWYTNQDTNTKYRLPMAYFVTNLVVYTYSFVAILRKMAKNSRLSKLTEKEDEYVFSWKLFTGWDFMIGNPETAHNRTASIVLGFKEVLLEEAEKQKDKRNWKIISRRIFVNVAVLSLLALSAYAVIEVVERSTTKIDSHSWLRQNEITIVMSLITTLFPMFFEILGFLESYHPRKQLRMQLARIMVLNLLNLYSLIFALFRKMNSMKPDDIYDLKSTETTCKYNLVECGDELTHTQQITTLATASLVFLSNITHFHAKREIIESTTLPSVRQETLFLNPFLDRNELYEDYLSNDTFDLSTIDYLYEDSQTNSNESYYERQDNRSVDDSRTYDYKNFTPIANFLTDSTIAEDFYTTSTLSQAKTPTSTETSTAEDSSEITDDFTEKTISSSSPDEMSSTEKISVSATVEVTPKTNTISLENSLPTLRSNDPSSRENYPVKCFVKTCNVTSQKNLIPSLEQLDPKIRRKVRRLCWETMFGQELAKLTVMDLVLTTLTTLCMDFLRAVFVRYMNNCWCWDLEKQFPQYGDFKIAENILHLVYNQGMVWMGMFFSPGLTVLNLLKLGILMYLRSWIVLTCNVPHEVVFRASRSNNFYFTLLLTMLFLCVLPVGYAIVWVEPSWHCGPFSGYPRIYSLVTHTLINSLPEMIQRCLEYVTSPGTIIPLIVLMMLIIYYMVSLAGSLREANNDLKMQLRHERTEERRKLFKIAEKRQNVAEAPLSTRWKKLLPALPQARVTELSRNSEITQRDDVQIAIGNSSDTTEGKGLTNKDIDNDSSRREQILSNNEKQIQEENDSGLNGTSSNKRSFVGYSWDSQSSEQSVIPEIQLNNELSNVTEDCDQETT